MILFSVNASSTDDTPISAKLKKILIKAPSLGGALSSSGAISGAVGGGSDIGVDSGGGVGGGESPVVEMDEASEAREKESGLTWKQRHQLKHRELFLSRQVETLPATHIRGKCSVTLLNETESFLSYVGKEVSRK